MLKGDDPGVQFQRVEVVKNSHIAIKLKTNDRVSANVAGYELPAEVRTFRTRIVGNEHETELMKRLDDRAAGTVEILEDETLMRGVYSLLSFLFMVFLTLIFGFFFL